MGREWAAFVPLAVVTNTAFGPPFDPVLLWFANGRPFPEAWSLIVAGSLCAGIGGALEAGALRLGGRATVVFRWAEGLARAAGALRGTRFYVFAFLVAASPAPFSMVRLASVPRRPAPLPYALSIAAGRVPRYALTIAAWHRLRPPDWVAGALFATVVLVAVAGWAMPRAWAASRRRRLPERTWMLRALALTLASSGATTGWAAQHRLVTVAPGESLHVVIDEPRGPGGPAEGSEHATGRAVASPTVVLVPPLLASAYTFRNLGPLLGEGASARW